VLPFDYSILKREYKSGTGMMIAAELYFSFLLKKKKRAKRIILNKN